MPNRILIPFALPLPLTLPTIEGNVDYRDFRDQLLRIDSLLVQSHLETQLLEADLQRWLARQKRVSALQIMRLSGREMKAGRIAQRVDRSVDFRA